MIFRPDLPTEFEADEVEQRSGYVDSIVVSRSEWAGRRGAIAQLLDEHEVLLQPYIEHLAGAIAHFWPDERMMRFAVAAQVSEIAVGASARCEGFLDLESGRFWTNRSELDEPAAALIAGVVRLKDRILALPPESAWELEMCLDQFGLVWFLQAQPSTARSPNEGR